MKEFEPHLQTRLHGKHTEMGCEGRGGEEKHGREKEQGGPFYPLPNLLSLLPPLLMPAMQVTANPLSLNIHIQIRQTDLYTFP